MSFHGALIGIVIGTYFFPKKEIKTFVVRYYCSSSANWNFFSRIANFINSELTGKATDVYWAVVFPKIDNISDILLNYMKR